MKSFKNKRSSSSSGDRPRSVSAPQRSSSNAASAAAALSPRSLASPTSSGNNDQFSARRSARVSTKKFAEGDNDTWHENLAVIENPQASAAAAAAASSSGRSSGIDNAGNGSANDGTAEAIPQLTLRSYFQSKSTGQRVWDEPPSGASNVVYASEEVRRMAMIQMEDLQVSTDVVRAASNAAHAEDGEDGDGSGDMKRGGGKGGKSTKPKVLGRFKIGRKQSSNSTEDGDNAKSNKKGGQRQRKIRYKPGRAPYGATAAYGQSIDEAQLERAKMLSLQELGGGDGDDTGGDSRNQDDGVEAAIAAARMNGDVVPSLPITQSEEEEEAAIQMAMAISLSEAEAQRAELSPMAVSIDDMRREAAVARPEPPENDYQYSNSNEGNGSSSLRYRGKSSKPTDDDRKPSARNLC